MKIIVPGSIIGIIGGGQLGRMSAIAAASLGYKVHIFTPEKNSPAEQVSYKTTIAEYTNQAALKKFADDVDVVTFEFENIPYETVKFLENNTIVRPSWKALYISQNRLREKTFVNNLGIPTAKFFHIKNENDLAKAVKKIKDKAILKTTELGYDGKGQFTVNEKTEAKKLWGETKIQDGMLEEFVNFDKEISVIIARGIDSKSITFPITHNIHKNGILDISTAPAKINKKSEKLARSYAKKIAEELGLIGILAIEFFVTKDGKVLVNEMAPRLIIPDIGQLMLALPANLNNSFALFVVCRLAQ